MSNEYLDIAMEKVVKQEVRKVLEQIKDEILFIAEKCLPNCTAEEYEVKGLKEALNVIDKYKAESEK